MKHKLRLVTLLLALIGLGYIREMVFVPLNEMIDAGAFDGLWLKWVLTLAFSGLYLALAISLVDTLFGRHRRPVLFFYLGFIFMAGLIYGAGVILGETAVAYTMARGLMGMVQSPILIMILIPAFFLADRTK